jgi:NADPH2:quinone reductase
VLREVAGDLALEEDWPEPTGTVVEVRAAGVNFADILIRRGLYPQAPELPYVLGNEVAGELDGQRVLALPRSAGGYADRVEVDPQWTFTLPDNASFAAGASFLTTYLTAYIPLHHQVRVTPASIVLVHAGSGGVGCAAIQLAKHLGAKVIATASSDEKRAFALGVGADEAISYDELDDLRVDVVIDPVGGDVFTRSLPLLNPLGAIVAIGFAGGLWTDPSVQWLVGRNASVVGVYLGRLMKLQPQLVHESAIELLALWARGEIDPVVGATFPLADAAAAHALIESRQHVGKVVLEP